MIFEAEESGISVLALIFDSPEAIMIVVIVLLATVMLVENGNRRENKHHWEGTIR